jgi:predicted TIM-barrel fold metal-dependent hydrolase
VIVDSPVPVIDLHHHLGVMDGLVAAGSTVTSADERFRFMDDHHIDQVVVLPQSGGVTSDNMASINAGVAQYRDQSPGRVAAALGTCDPTDPERAVAEIDRAVARNDLRGFVFHHHFQGTVINDPRMRPILARLAHHRLPAFIHILAGSILESPWRLEQLAHEHPDLTLVGLDGFSSPTQAGEMVHIAARCPNVFFDTGVLISVAHLLRPFIDAVGAERLLYGSDFYSSPQMFSVPFALYELLNLGLSERDLELVMSGNAKRLLQL